MHLINKKRSRLNTDCPLYCSEGEEDESWIKAEQCIGVAADPVSISVRNLAMDVDPDYLSHHVAIKPKMRSIVLDWMQQVCQEYGFCRETFHLAITYLDRYLCVRSRTRPSRLQLVGITALFLASKLEEVKAPCVIDFVYTCACSYAVHDIIVAEHDMVKALGWMLRSCRSPSSLATHYLQRAIDFCSSLPPHQRRLQRDLMRADRFIRIMEILDFARLFTESLRFNSSNLAASALFHVYDSDLSLLELATGVKSDEVADCRAWLAHITTTLPFIGLDPISGDEARHESDIYYRQVHHPLALEICLANAPMSQKCS